MNREQLDEEMKKEVLVRVHIVPCEHCFFYVNGYCMQLKDERKPTEFCSRAEELACIEIEEDEEREGENK